MRRLRLAFDYLRYIYRWAAERVAAWLERTAHSVDPFYDVDTRKMGMSFQPWTRSQVRNINDFQRSPFVHPMTCPEGTTLFAQRDGMYCHCCLYRQEWVYWFMTG